MLITTIYIDQTYQIEALFVTKEGEIVYSENKLIYLLWEIIKVNTNFFLKN